MIDWSGLEARNAPLNALIDLDRSAAFGVGPLSGLTIGVKSNIAVAGLPWTAGMAAFRGRIATEDASTVAALRAAGAAIIGTLNMEEAALGATTDNPWFGATHNPHGVGYSPGGSSGGSGAAVAAGLCDAALGTDTLGSVRIPASYCGIYGFKPAQAAVSQHGFELTEPSFDVIGPMARSLDILESVARVMSVFGAGAANPHPPITIKDLGGVECTPDVLRTFARARSHLGPVDEHPLFHPLTRVRFAAFIATTRAMSAHFASLDPELLSPNLRKLLKYGTARSAENWADDQRILAATANSVRELVAEHGIIMLPTAPQPAFRHGDPAPANQADLTCLASIAGLPAVSLPGGWTENRLPIGIQLVGQVGHEAGLFAVARRLDSQLKGYAPPEQF